MSDGTDNIIVDTATRILRDLCEPQTVNEAEKGVWPTALWDALEESGLNSRTTAACHAVTSFESRSHQPMMMSSATVSIGFLPNRDESFSSPRSLPLIVLSIISVEDQFERIAFTIHFLCITVIFHGSCA